MRFLALLLSYLAGFTTPLWLFINMNDFAPVAMGLFVLTLAFILGAFSCMYLKEFK